MCSPRIKSIPKAYEAYLQGRFEWNLRTTPSLNAAISYFQQAIGYDASYAPSYAGLADCYALLGSAPYTALRPSEAFPKAKVNAHKALELDPDLAEAHVSLGYSALVYDWNYPEAEREFSKAMELTSRLRHGSSVLRLLPDCDGRYEPGNCRKEARPLD